MANPMKSKSAAPITNTTGPIEKSMTCASAGTSIHAKRLRGVEPIWSAAASARVPIVGAESEDWL
jgi:hypothetical protein